MKKDEVYEILKSALVELFEIPEEKISLQSLIYEDLDIDSIDAIDLVDHIKRKTGRRLEPDDFRNVRTIDDIVEAVLKKVESA